MNDKMGKGLGLYVLKGRLAVPTDSMIEWSFALAKSNRQVAIEQLGEYVISTVFIGIDHSFGSGDPLLFETMVFKNRDSIEEERCGTWEEAIDMHERAVAKVIALIGAAT